jgi:hypothetical protein
MQAIFASQVTRFGFSTILMGIHFIPLGFGVFLIYFFVLGDFMSTKKSFRLAVTLKSSNGANVLQSNRFSASKEQSAGELKNAMDAAFGGNFSEVTRSALVWVGLTVTVHCGDQSFSGNALEMISWVKSKA